MSFTEQLCSLCGVPLHLNLRIRQYNLVQADYTGIGAPPPPWPNPPLPWTAEVRALIAGAQDGDVETTVRLSGIGVIAYDRKIHLARDGKGLPYKDTVEVQSLAFSNPPYLSSTDAVIFAVHNACWDLLLARLGSGICEDDIASAVFHQLCGAHRPSPRYEFDLGIEYNLPDKIQNVLARPDPLRIPSLDEIEATAPTTSVFLRRRDKERRANNPAMALRQALQRTATRNHILPVRSRPRHSGPNMLFAA
ncbi:hypothetical protein BJX70DRAFT_399095 [Aspergillus crustosus]